MLQCMLLASKLVALVLGALFQIFYNRRPGILNDPIISFIEDTAVPVGRNLHLQNRTTPGGQSRSPPKIHDEFLLDPKIFHERR